MKTDAFTKILLLAIAIFLSIIALRPLVQVGTVQASPAGFDYIKFIGLSGRGAALMDTRNGDVWEYEFYPNSKGKYYGRLLELGKPLVKPRR